MLMLPHVRPPRSLLRGSARALLLLALLPPGLAAQPAPVPFDGIEGFTQFLRYYGLQPLQTLEEISQVPPEDAVLIVLGDTKVLRDIPLRKLARSGVAILVASDLPDQGRLADLGVQIYGDPIRDPNHAYKNQAACPLIQANLDQRHPLTENLQALPTNRVSHLRKMIPFDLTMRFDDSVRIFLVARNQPPLLVLAGHGVFINGMLAQPDQYNFQFADRCVQFLSENKRRRQVLLVEDGRVIGTFEGAPGVPLPPRLPPPTGDLWKKILGRAEEGTQLLEESLADFERESLEEEMLWDDFTRVGVLQFVVLVVTAGLVFWSGWRFAHARQRWEAVPALWTGSAPPGPEPSAWRNRAAALAKVGRYQEPAQALLRDWFQKHGGIPAAAWDAIQVPLPEVQASSWWQRWSWRRRLQRWAAGAKSMPALSAREFRRLLRELQQGTSAIQAGNISLTKP